MTKTILVVDDEPDIVKTLKIALELREYTVQSAITGTEAVDMMSRSTGPDLVILDVLLPGMSGNDVACWMRNNEQYKKIPIIFMTAMAQKHEQRLFSDEQSFCCFVKPFDLEALETKVRELLNGASSHTGL